MQEKYYEAEKFKDLRLNNEVFENYKFVDCEFINCTFEDLTLLDCSFSSCKFQKCFITGIKAKQFSQAQYTEFIECQLVGVNWYDLLSSSKFAEPIREMHKCRLKYNHFTQMNFKKFNFGESEISDSMFAECELGESIFKDCKLDHTEFFKSDLRKADFRGAVGYQIDIMSCKLTSAKFSLPEAVSLLNGLGIKLD